MNNAVKGLGEVVLRVNNIDRCKHFYIDVIGLELIKEFPGIVFLKIAEGVDGHTQILGLFQETMPTAFDQRKQTVSAEATSLHHFALEICLKDYHRELARLQSLCRDVRVAEHAWCQWRSIYVKDPEDNIVEFVCFDQAIELV